MRPLTLKSHPDPYYLCQERRLFGPLGVEPQVEFEGPMFFFLYKSHWICGKGCFSGHHQSSYLWFGFIHTRLSQKSLKKPAMNPPSLFVSFSVWMAQNLSKSSLPASLGGSTNGISKKVMAWTSFIDFYGYLDIFSTCWHQFWNPTNLQLISKSWFTVQNKFVFPDCVPITWAWSKPWLSYRGVTIQVYKVWSEHVRAIKQKCRIPFWPLSKKKHHS